MRININMPAMMSARNLNNTEASLSKTIERLSSGLRINRAADDATDLAISETLRAQIASTRVAVSNAQDGISLIQTAEGGLDRVHALLRRVRDLVTFAANGDKTSQDRLNYQLEVDQLTEEIDRISKTTEYNTKPVLDGSIGSNAVEKGDGYNINQADLTIINQDIAADGEYDISILQPAERTIARIGGNTFPGGGAPQETDVGGLYSFLGNNPTQEGKYFFKVTMGTDSVIVETEARSNSGDTMSDAVNRFNEEFIAAKMEITAEYAQDAEPGQPGQTPMLQFVSNKFGSKYEIRVEVVNQPATGPYTEANRNSPASTSHNILNSDNSLQYGELPGTTPLWSANPEDKNTLDIDPVSERYMKIQQRDGTITNVDVQAIGAPPTIDNVATFLNGIPNITSYYDTQKNSLVMRDTSIRVDNNAFKINNSDAAGVTLNPDYGLADRLGIYFETESQEIPGIRISKTKDFILNVTHNPPNGDTALLKGNMKDRSTFFEGILSDSAVTSSGIDTDKSGPIEAGGGGIGGISFTLEEKALQSNHNFTIQAQKGFITFQIGPNESMDHRLAILVEDTGIESLGLTNLDLTSAESAQKIIDGEFLDKAIEKISLIRGKLGSIQNRLEHTIKNLKISDQNLSEAESRIRDLDFSEETVEMTRLKILQQAGNAMLAQANEFPRDTLSLLQQ